MMTYNLDMALSEMILYLGLRVLNGNADEIKLKIIKKLN